MSQFEQILTEGLTQLREDIIQSSKDAGQEASGRTYENITQEVRDNAGAVYAPSYFHVLLRGRGAGKIPANMVDLIKDWATNKGITFSDEKQFLRFCRAVAFTIKREGSELYRNHMYVDIIDTPVRKFEEQLDARITGLFDAEITKTLFPEGTTPQGYII